MERDFGIEIERLERDIEEIKRTLKNLNISGEGKAPGFLPEIQRMRENHPDPAMKMILTRLEASVTEIGETGAVTYMGVFNTEGRNVSWIESGKGTDTLLKLGESEQAASVLSSIGNRERIEIVTALLQEPMTVAGIIEACGYNSTGQAYHHLKPLVSAGIVSEDKSLGKGVYRIPDDKIKGVIMLLSSVRDLMK